MNSDSDSEIAAMRNQVYVLLIALIVVSGTMMVFFYRQASLARKDYNALRPQASQVVTTLTQNQPVIVSFVNQLVAFGQSHPDFVPILARHGITVPPKGVSPVAPVSPAAPKK